MNVRTKTLCLRSPEDTAALACRLGLTLRPGDIITLEGDIGSGKTFFARALIQSLQDAPEDVPSPTFTLIQTYETRVGPVWHADLYRLSSTAEIEELGLLEAIDEAICLIEWPDRMGDLRPESALALHIEPAEADNAREVSAQWIDPKWDCKWAEST